MKVATWNLGRPAKNSKKTEEIIKILRALDADILVLTETNDFIGLDAGYNVYHTAILQDKIYKAGERRVSIFSKYTLADKIKGFETFKADTSLCVNFKTPLGELAVYGTVLGVWGNKGIQFKNDLEKQLVDFETITGKAKNFCISGDFNISFSDNYYFTDDGRKKLNLSFENCGLKNYTKDVEENIDHIILTEKFVGKRRTILSYWNDIENKQTRLSDHKGVMIEIVE